MKSCQCAVHMFFIYFGRVTPLLYFIDLWRWPTEYFLTLRNGPTLMCLFVMILAVFVSYEYVFVSPATFPCSVDFVRKNMVPRHLLAADMAHDRLWGCACHLSQGRSVVSATEGRWRVNCPSETHTPTLSLSQRLFTVQVTVVMITYVPDQTSWLCPTFKLLQPGRTHMNLLVSWSV